MESQSLIDARFCHMLTYLRDPARKKRCEDDLRGRKSKDWQEEDNGEVRRMTCPRLEYANDLERQVVG
jgi:hypothetical protein